jgi:WD40 repeat protein
MSVANDSSIRIWDTTGNLLKTLYVHTSCVYDVIFSPDNLKIISSICETNSNHSRDNHCIKIWDVESGNLLNTLKKMKTSFHFFEKIFNTHYVVSIKYFEWSTDQCNPQCGNSTSIYKFRQKKLIHYLDNYQS